MKTILACLLVLALLPIVALAENKAPQAPGLALEHHTVSESAGTLPDSLLAVAKKQKIPTSNVSVYVRDLNADQAMLEHEIDAVRSPASTLKLLTTFAALDGLGPNYRWSTEAWARGNVENGVLDGDLILKGYGDPFLVYERFWKFVHEIQDRGLRKITGNIIVDSSAFSLPRHNNAAFDGQSMRVYNAGPSPLMFNFQASRVLVRAPADPSSTNADVQLFPPGLTAVDNQVTWSKGRCKRRHGRPRIRKNADGGISVKGAFASGCKPRFVMRLISDSPERHAFNAFRYFWNELGGEFAGGLRRGVVKKGDKLLHSYSSPSLGEQIRLINKWSNNVMTRQLLLTLGAARFGWPATLEKGRRAISEAMSVRGIDIGGLLVDNGSGLSRKSRITARQMANLLESAYRDPFMPEFMSSMALTGLDGTLASRFRGEALAGRNHLKTGTLNQVTAIAGYMLNRRGRRLVIVIMHNGPRANGGRGGKLQDAVLRWAFEQ